MNEKHLEFCASPVWAEIIEREVLPWAVGERDLGDDVLEIGAGPGLTTDVLRRQVERLTAVELDAPLAEALRKRLDGTTSPSSMATRRSWPSNPTVLGRHHRQPAGVGSQPVPVRRHGSLASRVQA